MKYVALFGMISIIGLVVITAGLLLLNIGRNIIIKGIADFSRQTLISLS